MNLYYLSPEIALFATAFLIIGADFFLKRKGLLAVLGIVGALVSAGLTLTLWGTRDTTFNGLLVVDEFALFFKLLFLGACVLVILSSVDYVAKFARFQGEYYALVLFAAGGMMLMAATGELISIYIALELTALSLCALVCFLKDSKSVEAALKYLLLSAVSSAILLYGMALVFGLSGSTHLEEIAGKVAGLLPGGQIWDNPALLAGMVLLVAGFGFKIASVPFQMWVPDVYEGAPTPITAYLSVASKAAGFAVILRVFYTALGTPSVLSLDWAFLFAVLSAITMSLGNVVAIAQANIKRMLGYSSIAQAGYLMVGLATITNLGQSGLLFFLASYALANLGAFIAIIAISNKTGSDLIEDYRGMARRAPLLALALAFCLISLIGLPPTAGFIAKVYIFNAAVQQGLLWLVVIAVINSVVSAYYYLRVVKMMYVGAPASEEKVPSSGALRLGLFLSSVAVLFLGVLPAPLLGVAERVASFFP